MTVVLRGLCWDHPRCTEPMATAAAAYRARRDVTVQWRARPLRLFNDQPPWELDGTYDLVFVDHPMSGAIAERTALVPLDTVLDAETLRGIAKGSIGRTHESYTWAGHQWALGVDAASQVAAVHEERLGADAPSSWDDVLSLAKSSPGAVALPLYPSDAICTLVSLSANSSLAAGDPATWLRLEAAEFLVELVGLLDGSCFDLNPPALLDAMAGASDIAYVPFVFGYATLARPPIAFADVAGIDGTPRGAVLGGAGLGVLPTSSHIAEAAEFAAWCMTEPVQRDVILRNGGQPGGRAVWDAATGATDAERFLRSTRRTIDDAYVRPRDPWWPRLQKEAGVLLVELLRTSAEPRRIVDDLTALAERHRSAA